MNVPCKDCKDRELKCHMHCIEYIQWKNELNEINNKIKNIHRLESATSRRHTYR